LADRILGPLVGGTKLVVGQALLRWSGDDPKYERPAIYRTWLCRIYDGVAAVKSSANHSTRMTSDISGDSFLDVTKSPDVV